QVSGFAPRFAGSAMLFSGDFLGKERFSSATNWIALSREIHLFRRWELRCDISRCCRCGN
ncbi:MAG: hypothetical protein OER56_08555, partial [Hyphomicrobiales bacterium]|nr:hypothetical protein [Hyphomicrobiales bacterium]